MPQLVLRAVVFCVGGALIHSGHQLEMNMCLFAFQPGTPWLAGNGVILTYITFCSIRFADSQPINIISPTFMAAVNECTVVLKCRELYLNL